MVSTSTSRSPKYRPDGAFIVEKEPRPASREKRFTSRLYGRQWVDLGAGFDTTFVVLDKENNSAAG